MSFIGNILWIVLGGGIFICIEYLIGGLLLCLTIIGIPFGIQCWKLAGLALAPFGKQITHKRSAGGCLGSAMNLIWLVFLGGIVIAATHVLFAVLCAVTIIGIPFARQHVKLAALALTPFGLEIR